MRLTASVLAVVFVLVGIVVGQNPGGTATPNRAAATTESKKAWPVAFGETAAPATKADDGGFAISTLVTNTSGADQAVRASAFVRTATGGPVDATVACATRPAQKDPTSTSCDVLLPPGPTLLALTVTVTKVPRDAYPLGGAITLQPKEPPPAGTWTEDGPLAKLVLPAIPMESASVRDWELVRDSAASAVIAAVMGTLICFLLWGPGVWIQRMGAAEFKFNESWSGALMVGGPLLTGLVTTFTGFPEYSLAFSKKSYVFLSLLLTAVIALGPSVYSLFRVPTETTDKDGNPITQSQGVVLGFFIAAGVALAGGLAQLGLLGAMFGDLASARIISTDFGDVLVTATDVLFWLIVGGSIVSMITTVAVFAKPTAATAKGPASTMARGIENRVKRSAPGPLPSWSLP
jgi:hypothetical protein